MIRCYDQSKIAQKNKKVFLHFKKTKISNLKTIFNLFQLVLTCYIVSPNKLLIIYESALYMCDTMNV